MLLPTVMVENVVKDSFNSTKAAHWESILSINEKDTGWYFHRTIDRLSYGDATEAHDGCLGSIERIDGTNIQADTISAGRTIQVDGWLAANAIKGIPTEETFLTIDRPGHPTVYVSTRRTYRFDVSKIFGHKRLDRSGFTATADMSGMQGICRLGLAMVFEGNLIRCPAFKVMLRVQ